MTQAQLRALLHYDAETGVFTWLVHRGGRSAGSVAGCCNDKGYVTIRIFGVGYLSHILAWLYEHGSWPSQHLDHRDGNPSNNRIANLRLASVADNRANSKADRDGTSGHKGVTFYARKSQFAARIMRHGRRHFLGYFDTAEDAHAAYSAAATELCGEFARAA